MTKQHFSFQEVFKFGWAKMRVGQIVL
jgi:hypothetical protein